MYRPQFAYPTPEGCRDIDWIYFFDGSNTPLLNQSIKGLTISNIPLVLEQDVAFYWRGIKVNPFRDVTGTTPDTYSTPDVKVRFEDNYYNKLSDDFVPAVQYGYPSNPWTFSNQRLTGPPVPIAEIYCPPGSVLWLYLVGPSSLNSDTHFLQIALYGVKRFKEC